MPELRDELARAGATAHEAAELAALLERAAKPARFEVTRAEVESALERARPARRPLRVPRIALAAAALAAAALALILVLPSGQQSVQARALDAVSSQLLHLRLEVFSRVPGTAGTTVRDEWFDPERGRARWTVYDPGGAPFAETLVERGRFERLLTSTSTLLVGSSCRAFAAGCSELLDPVTRYREVLARGRVRAERTTFGGRATYRFVLPLRGRIDQVVYVDAQTYLPRTILWREHEKGQTFVVVTIDVANVETVSRADASSQFTLPRAARVLHVVPAGRRLGARPLTHAEAVPAHPFWLGRRGLTALERVRYALGSVYVARYAGGVEVWTYGRAVPAELLAPQLAETKTLAVGGRLATLFSTGARLALVVDGNPSFAILSYAATKEDVVREAERARRLR